MGLLAERLRLSTPDSRFRGEGGFSCDGSTCFRGIIGT